MSRTLQRWKIYCTTESKWVEQWLKDTDSAPTTCPDDTGHTVDANSICIAETVSEKITPVRLNQYSATDPDVNSTVEYGFSIPVEVGVNPSVSEIIAFPFDIDFVSGCGRNPNQEDGDYIEAIARPKGDAAIGTVSEDATSGQDKVKVSAAAWANLRCGHFVKFSTHSTEYRIDAMDDATNELTLNANLADSLSALDPVRLRVKMAQKRYVLDNGVCALLNEVLEASPFPNTMEFFIRYYHKTDPASNYTIYGNITMRY